MGAGLELRTTTDIYKFKELPVTVRLFEFWVYPYWREHKGRKESSERTTDWEHKRQPMGTRGNA
jgi:hypothetical protein